MKTHDCFHPDCLCACYRLRLRRVGARGDELGPDRPSDQKAAPNAQAPSRLSQRLRDDLTKAGFTDITIMPSSFLVRAKDSQGNPVMMVINPDNFTERRSNLRGRSTKMRRSRARSKANRTAPIPSPPPKQ